MFFTNYLVCNLGIVSTSTTFSLFIIATADSVNCTTQQHKQISEFHGGRAGHFTCKKWEAEEVFQPEVHGLFRVKFILQFMNSKPRENTNQLNET